MAYGGMAKRKPMMYGGTAKKTPAKRKMMAGGGGLKMVKKGDKMVPFYAADGIGKS